jgi:hypothetical protein
MNWRLDREARHINPLLQKRHRTPKSIVVPDRYFVTAKQFLLHRPRTSGGPRPILGAMAQAMHNLGRIVDAAFIQEPIEPFAGGSVVGSRVLTKQWSRDSARMAQKNARQDNRPEGSYRPSASVLMQATVVTMPFGRQADCSSTTARAALHTGPAAK